MKNYIAGHDTHTRTRFLAELLTACKDEIDPSVSIGNGLTLNDIMNNLDTAGKITGFSGVYIDIGTGSLPAFRAMVAKTKDKPLKSITFAMNKHGLQSAWMQAVRKRAEFVGYVGPIPEVPHPSVEIIADYCRIKKGDAWMEERDIVNKLKIASEKGGM